MNVLNLCLYIIILFFLIFLPMVIINYSITFDLKTCSLTGPHVLVPHISSEVMMSSHYMNSPFTYYTLFCSDEGLMLDTCLTEPHQLSVNIIQCFTLYADADRHQSLQELVFHCIVLTISGKPKLLSCETPAVTSPSLTSRCVPLYMHASHPVFCVEKTVLTHQENNPNHQQSSVYVPASPHQNLPQGDLALTGLSL